jgi:hypothetical protein
MAAMTHDPEVQAMAAIEVEGGRIWGEMIGAAYNAMLDAGMSKAAVLSLIELRFATPWVTQDDDDL